MIAFIEEHPAECITVLGAVLLLFLVLSIVARLFHIAICLAIAAIMIPIAFTIFWGDGTEYVQTFASFLQPKYEQQVNEAYAYFKAKDSEDPFVDYDAVSKTATDIFQDVKGRVEEEWPHEPEEEDASGAQSTFLR